MKFSTHTATWMLALAGVMLSSVTAAQAVPSTSSFPNGGPKPAANGNVTWPNNVGNYPRNKAVDDVIPRKKNGKNGLLKFHWTKNGAVHPNYAEYHEESSAVVKRTRHFMLPKDRTITDWNQTFGHVGGGKSNVTTGNIEITHPSSGTRAGAWAFAPLEDLPVMDWRIPDLAPTEADATIYTGVNAGLYLSNNPDGFLGGMWAVGDMIDDLGISIVNGSIPGLEGIIFATTPFVFDPSSEIGWSPVGGAASLLNSSDYQAAGLASAIQIIGAHAGFTVPTPGTLSIASLAGLTVLRRRRRG